MVWSLLDKKRTLAFGEECASAVVVMVVLLLLRTIIIMSGLGAHYFPLADIICVSPIFIQYLMMLCPFFGQYPLLPVRLAESIMGISSFFDLMVVIPAQILGNLIGIVLFRTITPAPLTVFEPAQFDQNSMLLVQLITQLFSVFMYTIVVLLTPDLLAINKIDRKLLSIPTIPFLLMNSGRCSTLNPSAIYALWYINNCNISWSPFLLVRKLLSSSSYLSSSSSYSSSSSLPSSSSSSMSPNIESDLSTSTSTSDSIYNQLYSGSDYNTSSGIIITLIAAILAGWFLKMHFPKDGSWVRNKTIYYK